MGRRPAAVPEPSLSCVGLSRGLCGGEALILILLTLPHPPGSSQNRGGLESQRRSG